MENISQADLWQAAWEQMSVFIGSRAFIVSISLFGLWLILGRTLRFIKDIAVKFFTTTIAVISPFAARKLIFNTVSLVFMVAGISTASAAKGKLDGSDGHLEAYFGGGLALAFWGIVILISNQLQPKPIQDNEK